MMYQAVLPKLTVRAAILIIALASPEVRAQTVTTSLLGVWQPISIDSVGSRPRRGPTPPTVGPSGPGLLIFANQHYAQVAISTPGPRPALPDSAYTLEDVLASWGPFNGSAGTYRITGDTVFMRPSVARNPRTMTNFRWRFVFRLVGDTLWLTNVAEQITGRWRRVE
jgi:hypothetical protein